MTPFGSPGSAFVVGEARGGVRSHNRALWVALGPAAERGTAAQSCFYLSGGSAAGSTRGGRPGSPRAMVKPRRAPLERAWHDPPPPEAPVLAGTVPRQVLYRICRSHPSRTNGPLTNLSLAMPKPAAIRWRRSSPASLPETMFTATKLLSVPVDSRLLTRMVFPAPTSPIMMIKPSVWRTP